jgi:CheY-like chemotaxis protein
MFHVLLIDDNSGSRESVARILRQHGYTALTATTAAEGLALIRSHTVHIVLADVRLPDGSGIDVLRTIRSEGDTVPFVLIAGFATTGAVVAAFRLGATDVLEKPLQGEQLLEIVPRCLSSKPSSHQVPHGNVIDPMLPAAMRWARALMPILSARDDPKTVADWSKVAYSSAGAIRNWCRTANVPARRSLVVGRLLRAILLTREGFWKPEDLLDVVDRRTLQRMLTFAGVSSGLPVDVDEFLDRQAVIRDPILLCAIRNALIEHFRPRDSSEHPGSPKEAGMAQAMRPAQKNQLRVSMSQRSPHPRRIGR